MNYSNEIQRIIEAAERAAYNRGRDDALKAIASAVELALAGNNASVRQRKRGGRPASGAMKTVRDCIAATPGMTGVQVVNAVRSVDSSIKERTIRTCLRRLRVKGDIRKRGDGWSAAPKEKSL